MLLEKWGCFPAGLLIVPNILGYNEYQGKRVHEPLVYYTDLVRDGRLLNYYLGTRQRIDFVNGTRGPQGGRYV